MTPTPTPALASAPAPEQEPESEPEIPSETRRLTKPSSGNVMIMTSNHQDDNQEPVDEAEYDKIEIITSRLDPIDACSISGTDPSNTTEPPSTISNKDKQQTTQEQNQTSANYRSRLLKTSKAIIFFRRAASSLTGLTQHLNRSQNDDVNTQNNNNPLGTHFIRQNTRESQQNYKTRNCGTQNLANDDWFGSSEVPRFIVPKMNHLKLPLVCRIKSIEDELMREVFVHQYELGQYLMENLKISIGIQDTKYFGFKMAKYCDDQEFLRNPWIDMNEPIFKQIRSRGLNALSKSSSSNSFLNSSQRTIDFYLRIKFYPPNLCRIQDPFLNQYLWLQLRRDLRLGKLTSSVNNLTYLVACVLQYELGDFNNELVPKIATINILPNQDLIEDQAIELWQTKLVGSKKHKAQMQFLRAAIILETYGFDYYPVKDHQRQRAYLLGFNYAGVKTIRNGRIVHHFRWHSLNKISHERRMIIIHVQPRENSMVSR